MYTTDVKIPVKIGTSKLRCDVTRLAKSLWPAGNPPLMTWTMPHILLSLLPKRNMMYYVQTYCRRQQSRY